MRETRTLTGVAEPHPTLSPDKAMLRRRHYDSRAIFARLVALWTHACPGGANTPGIAQNVNADARLPGAIRTLRRLPQTL